MPRPAPRQMTVVSSRQVSPSLLRVTLGGDGMVGYPEGNAGGYVKFMFPPAPGAMKPTVRTYTIRNQREGEIDIDFALHGDGESHAGPATTWALQAEPGQTIELGGPGAAKPLPSGFDYYIVAGDMTALPAIGVNLEALDRDARGIAIIEIQSESDKQAIDAPEGVAVTWLINPVPGSQPDLLVDAVRAVVWPKGKVYAWAASEFTAMRGMRQYLRTERGLGPAELYISSYWKLGLNEDDHRSVKREDMETSGEG